MRGDTLPAPLRVLLTTQFGLFAAGNGLSLIGTWMQRIAASWLVWDWTGSAFWLGVLAAADLLPVVLIGPVAGVAADRWDRLRQNQIAQLLSIVLTGSLATLLVLDMLNLGLLILFVALQGSLVAAVQPARLAIVQQMVPREDIRVAVALNSVNVNLARLVGPALAGLLIAQSQLLWIFAINAATTVVFVGVLSRVRVAPRESKTSPGSFLALMREGFAYVLGTPPIRLILLMLLAGGITVRALLELVPAIAAQTFTDTAVGLAVLTGAAATGAIVSGLTVGGGAPQRLLPVVLGWWASGAAAAIALAYAPGPVLAVASAALLGASVTRALVGTQTFVQLGTPDELRGRALSVHGLFARGSPALGALAVGYAADRVGLGPSVTVSAALLLVCVALAFSRLRGQGAGGY